MGDPTREPPFFFTKPADAVVPNHATIPYPSRTKNLHHEIELVLAIGKPGRDIAAGAALDHVFGYAVGNDLTRRDLQFEARDKGRPWDTGDVRPFGGDHGDPPRVDRRSRAARRMHRSTARSARTRTSRAHLGRS
jgi:fumarylpyruvate hydrolase